MQTGYPIDKSQPLPVPPVVRSIHRSIVEQLKELINNDFSSCTDPAFQCQWEKITGLIGQCHEETINASPLRKACTKGCSICCRHWVDEVCSFEAAIIADFLESRFKDKLPSIVERCREDIEIFERLEVLVAQKLSVDAESENIDAQDLLLSIFYRMDRPCPLLENGVCIAYQVRPLTCRGYVSFSNARFCRPEHGNDAEAATYLFGLDDKSQELVNKLHERYKKFEGDYGLRSLLPKYLDQ
jgi:Fe-S-cluster containining protein